MEAAGNPGPIHGFPKDCGGGGGSRTLKNRFSKLMMAKDFWQQVSAGHHVEAVSLSSTVSLSPHESTPVLATLWQRPAAYCAASFFEPSGGPDWCRALL